MSLNVEIEEKEMRKKRETQNHLNKAEKLKTKDDDREAQSRINHGKELETPKQEVTIKIGGKGNKWTNRAFLYSFPVSCQ